MEMDNDDSDIHAAVIQKLMNDATLTDRENSYICEFLGKHLDCVKRQSSISDADGIVDDDTSDGAEEETVQRESVSIQTDKIPAIFESHKSIKKFLASEWSKPTNERDEAKCDRAIAELFRERRSMIMGEVAPSVGCLRECYPYLFDVRQGISEFSRIVRRNNVFTVFEENIRRFSPLLPDIISPSPFNNKVMDKINSAETEESKAFMQVAGFLIMLPKYLGEDLKSCILFEDEHHDEKDQLPYIRCSCSVTDFLEKKALLEIYVENIKFCEPKSPVQAFFLLLATYFIFNIEYQEKIRHTLTVLQLYFAEIKGLGEAVTAETTKKMNILVEKLKDDLMLSSRLVIGK